LASHTAEEANHSAPAACPTATVGVPEILIDPRNNGLMPSYALDVEWLYAMNNKLVMGVSGIYGEPETKPLLTDG